MIDTRVTLTNLVNEESSKLLGTLTCTYSLSHNDTKTTLEQHMKLIRVNGKWKAKLVFDEFPNMDKPQEAAQKMALWLEKMAATIRVYDFSKIDMDDL